MNSTPSKPPVALLALLALLGTPASPPSPARAATADPAANLAYPPEVAAWTDADKRGQIEAAEGLVARLREAVAAGSRRFVIPPGHYRFDGTKTRNFALRGVADLEIAAEGATFWFDGRLRIDGLSLRECRRVALRGLTVDYDPLRFTQGQIEAIDRKERHIDILLDLGFPVPDESWTEKSGTIKALFYSPEGRQREVRMDWARGFASLGPRRYRVSFQGGWFFDDQSDLRVGDRLVLPDRSRRQVLASHGCEELQFEDLTIYAAPQMALTEGVGEGGNVYRRCHVVRRPGTGRLLACNADVFHSVMMRRGPRIEECRFEHAGDDFINVHGFFSMVLGLPEAGSLDIASHPLPAFQPGSRLDFVDYAVFKPLGSATARQVHLRDEADLQASLLRLADDYRAAGQRPPEFPLAAVKISRVTGELPPGLKRGDLVGGDGRAAGGTVIRGNRFSDGFTRGILVKADGAIIENNRLERIGSAGIGLAAERHWLEGPFPRNVTVRDNTLVDCGAMLNARMRSQWYLGAIAVTSVAGASPAEGLHNRQITVTGNHIVRPAVCGIFVTNTAGIHISGNRIEHPCCRELVGGPGPWKGADPNYAIYVARCQDVTLGDNTVGGAGEHCRGDLGTGPEAGLAPR